MIAVTPLTSIVESMLLWYVALVIALMIESVRQWGHS